MQPTVKSFQQALGQIIAWAERQGKDHIDVKSGDLHRRIGGYPSRNHRMPTCCAVMRRSLRPGDRILHQPPSGKGATLTVRYKLPR